MLKENIINLRNSFGYSQEEVAEEIGISRQAYAKWEKGQIVIPKKAREIMGYKPGESLLVLGDESTGLAILRTKDFISGAFAAIKEARKKGE